MNWALKWSWEEVEVDPVEMFRLATRSVPVDVSLWILIIHGHIKLEFALKVSVSRNSMITFKLKIIT